MANPLFNMLNKPQSLPFDRNNLMRQLNQFRQNFQGDPQQKVQELLNSGQMSQEQFSKLSQMANQIQSMFQ